MLFGSRGSHPGRFALYHVPLRRSISFLDLMMHCTQSICRQNRTKLLRGAGKRFTRPAFFGVPPMIVSYVFFRLPGGSLCLDAFIVTVNQAHIRGMRRCYTSTLEPQLASMEFCKACRSVPTLHVRIGAQAPRNLWLPPESQTSSNSPSSEDCISSRVPVVRAHGMTWTLPMEVLVRHVATKLWEWLVRFQLEGSISAASLESVVWPKHLKRLR